MTHIADRPSSTYNREVARRAPNELRDRNAGARVLNRVDVSRPGAKTNGEREMSLTDIMRQGVRGAAIGHLRRVRELHKQHKGVELPMNADTVQLAYISQKARLNSEEVTDEMTHKQLMYELMAKAVLFAPQVSDALRTKRAPKLSEYQDILAEIIDSTPGKMEPGFKTAIIEALRLESLALNQQIGHSSEVSGKNPESGIIELVSRLNGASLENAPKRAMKADPRLEVTTPEATPARGVNLDLKGIDMIVERPEDGKVIDIDTKARGKYLSTVADHLGIDRKDVQESPYFYMGIHEVTGHPHYLLNANSFSQIPAENFDFTPAGQEKVRQLVHQMLDA